MIMASTMREALHSFLVVCFIIGISVYPAKQPNIKNRWIVYLSILYSFMIWCCYVYIVYYAVNRFLVGFDPSILHYFVIFINVLSTITYTVPSFYYQERFTICMAKLDAVDDTLQKLGTPKMHKKICTLSKQMIIGGLIYLVIIDIYDMYWWLQDTQNILFALILTCITNHIVHINLVVDSLFVFFLWYVGNRFDKVNEHLQRLLVEKQPGIRCTWNRSAIAVYQSTNNYKQIFWTSMHLHLELRRIARELNSIFEKQMVFETAAYFIYLAIFIYQFLVLIMQYPTKKVSLFGWFATLNWILSLIIRLYIINYLCDNVGHKANKTCRIIHQLTNIIRLADVWKEVYQFALQLMFHPLKFTGLGLFQFGHRFIWKLYIAITTYVMIMMQFKTHVDVIRF